MTKTDSKTEKAPRRKWLKIFRWGLFIILAALIALVAVDCYVSSFSRGKLYTSVDKIPHRKAALVLGCGKYVEGRINLFYQKRINAAAELWAAGKVDAIIVSGDNSRKGYDEPSEMKADLVEKGVPAEYITIDYAGFRTLDSVLRAEQVFGLEKYAIVSQRFHCSRAIYLASRQGQEAIGYCAADVSGKRALKVRLREVLARTKAVVDVLFAKSPKYLGKPETVHYRAENKSL
jgi:SanA protein